MNDNFMDDRAFDLAGQVADELIRVEGVTGIDWEYRTAGGVSGDGSIVGTRYGSAYNPFTSCNSGEKAP